MTFRRGVLLAGTALGSWLPLGSAACSGSTDGSGGNGGGSGAKAGVVCMEVCKKLALGGCPEGGGASDCAGPCLERWTNCEAWPALVDCLQQSPSYSCQGTPPCAALLQSVVACGGSGPPDAGLVDCTPGEPVPACVCDGGSGPVHICDASGKTPACACP